MGAFRRKKAKTAYDDIIRGPQVLVEQRAKIMQDFYAQYELFTDADGFLAALGYRENFDFYDSLGAVSHTLQFSLHETCTRLGEKRAILFGYAPTDVLKYNLDSGVFTATPDLQASAGLQVSVLLTDLDATQEVTLSTNVSANTTVYTPTPTGTIANSFSAYVGNYYLVRDKKTGQIVDFDDDQAPYTNLPFLPANVINGVTYGPEPEEPSAATDQRFDFRLNDENLAIMDRYRAKQTLRIMLNTVSPENSFIVGETIVLGTESAVIYQIDEANTEVMTATIRVDEISDLVSFAGQTANLELQQPAVITTGKEIRGLTSTAKGLISATTPSFRWANDAIGIEFDENVPGVNNQDYFIKDYATMNLEFYTTASTLEPAKLYMRYNLQAGIANQVSGFTESPSVTPNANVANPTLLQTIGLKRWIDMSPLDENGIPDGSLPPHTTALLAVTSARGLQINYQWYQGTSFLTLGVQDMTKMNQTTWETYLGYINDPNNSITASADPNIISSSEPTDLNDSHNGFSQFSTNIEAGQFRTGECFPAVELNPHYPAVSSDAAFPDQMPFANTYVAYNLLRPAEIDYIVYAYHRWTYQVSPLRDHGHAEIPGGQTFQSGDTVSRIDPAFQRLKAGKLSDGSNAVFNEDWVVPASTNITPLSDGQYGPTQAITSQSLGSDSPFAGPGASSSTAGYISNGSTGQFSGTVPFVAGRWYTKNQSGRIAPSGFSMGSPPFDGEHIMMVTAWQTFHVNDFYTTTQSTFNVITQQTETTTVTLAGDGLRYYSMTVNTAYYDHDVNTIRKMLKTMKSGMGVSSQLGYADSNDFQLVINCAANLESPQNWSESHLEFEDPYDYDYNYNAVSGTYPLERDGALKDTDSIFNTFALDAITKFRATNDYNEVFWTNFGTVTTTQTYSPPTETGWLDNGVANSELLIAQFVSWRDKCNDYCANINTRIGQPHIFVADASGQSVPELGAKSYSGMLYGAVATMLSGSTGLIKNIKNALDNINSVYEDIDKKRRVYKTYGPVDTVS